MSRQLNLRESRHRERFAFTPITLHLVDLKSVIDHSFGGQHKRSEYSKQDLQQVRARQSLIHIQHKQHAKREQNKPLTQGWAGQDFLSKEIEVNEQKIQATNLRHETAHETNEVILLHTR